MSLNNLEGIGKWKLIITNLESATLAGGCFWCVEAAFTLIKGVELVEPGYTGGLIPNLSFERGIKWTEWTCRSGTSNF
jgi:peptide methionine sulfoxide reductase MsrA